MSLTINSNTMALNAQRNLERSNKTLATVFKRLSSGMRINQAKEDSAGLSISTRMEAQIREHNQAIRNVNDGISMAQVAEGGMQEAINIMQRMRELAVQAANDTYTSGDRADLELELDELKAHLNSIASDTEFNGQKLLDGSLTGKSIAIGKDESVSVDISQSLSTSETIGTETINGLVASYSFDGDANDGSGNNHNGTVNGDATLTIDRFGNSNSAYNLDGNGDYITVPDDAAFENLTEFTASVWINFTDLASNTPLPSVGSSDETVPILSKWLSSGGPDNTFSLVERGGYFRATVGNGASAESFDVNHDINVNEWHKLSFVFDNGNIAIYSDANKLSSDTSSITSVGDSTQLFRMGDWYSTFNASYSTLNGAIDDVRFYNRALSESEIQTSITMNDISVSSRSYAESSIRVIDNYINAISDQQASVGALQSRFESIQNNLMNAMENTSQARSRIMDADIAHETANLTTASILQQAGIAILAQANQQPQIALQLLG